MDAVKLPDAVKAGVRAALAARDFVALEQLLERTALRSAELELLLKFPALRGGTEILEAASGLVRNRRSEWALKELGRVRELLEVYGLGETVRLDLGAIRDFDYYTGIIFEGYGPDLGRPVAQGGRYDGLLARFGRPPSAPRLAAAIAWSDSGFETALRLGSTLRLFGMHAVVDTQARDHEDALAWSRALHAANLVVCHDPTSVSWTAPGRRTKKLTSDEVATRLASTVGTR